MQLFQPQAIIFDFDGVIVESVDIKGEAFYELYKGLSSDIASKVLASHKALGGVSRSEKIKLWHKEFLGLELSPSQIQGLADRFGKIVEDKVVAAPYVAGIETFLRKPLHGMRLYVASATPEAELQEIIRRKGIAQCFQGVYGFPTSKTEIIRKILLHNNLSPHHALMIGDSLQDLDAARATGVHFLGRKTPNVTFPPDVRGVPDFELLKQDLFLREYLALIAEVGRKVRHTEAWWATWASSKNEFSSGLHESLTRLYETGDLHCRSRLEQTRILMKSVVGALKYSVRTARGVSAVRRSFGSRVIDFKKQHSQSQGLYVIKTFAYPHSFSAGFFDPFFGKLPHHLKDSKRLNVLTVFDFVGDLRDIAKKCRDLGDVIPIHAFASSFDLVRAWIHILRGFVCGLPSRFSFAGKDVTKTLNRQYRLDLLSSSGVRHFCDYYSFKRLSKTLPIATLTVTHENDPWERMCILAIRRASPRTKIIGYQHTTAPLALVNLFSGPGDSETAPLPDKILTVGEMTAEVLRTYGNYAPIPVEAACALRFEHIKNSGPMPMPSQRTLLVALDGVRQTAEMIDFVTAQMASVKGWKVIIRDHPAYTLADLEFSHGRKFRFDSLSDWEISKRPHISEDIRKASVVLYWGSSVALEAIGLGRPVVYFDDGRLLSNDVLFQIQSSRMKGKAGASTNLPDLLNQLVSMTADELQHEQAKARQFVDRYFLDVTAERMDKFL